MSQASCDTHTTKTHPNKAHTQVVAMVAQTRQVDEWVWVWIGGCGSPNTVLLSFLSNHLGAISVVHPHILLHSTSIPQHTATTTMPTVSPTTTQSLRSDTAIALFVCTPSTIPFCLLSLFASTHACGPHSCTSKHTVSSHLLPTTTLCGVCVFMVLARERKEAGNDNKEAWEKRV